MQSLPRMAPKQKQKGQPKEQVQRSACHSKIRKPVLALCKATNAAAAAQLSKDLQAALLEAEVGNEPVDGGLLGMAAAQAGRLGLKDLLSTLCAYAWPRLNCCGGREVAELAAAASKCGCDDERFFCFVAASDAARDVIVAMATSVRPQLHKASAQDIAKTTGAASMAWSLFPQLQEIVLRPLLQELAQAVRFRHNDFNPQDVAHLCVAFAKVDGIPDFSTSFPVLVDKVDELSQPSKGFLSVEELSG
eukprot:g7001.t1